MNVAFTPAQESSLRVLARQEGKDVAEFVADAALRRLTTEEHFLAKLDRSIAQLERGELVEDDLMEARIEKMLSAR